MKYVKVRFCQNDGFVAVSDSPSGREIKEASIRHGILPEEHIKSYELQGGNANGSSSVIDDDETPWQIVFTVVRLDRSRQKEAPVGEANEKATSSDSCGGCRFYVKASEPRKEGLCRRLPPTPSLNLGDYALYPRVIESDWCGEWRPAGLDRKCPTLPSDRASAKDAPPKPPVPCKHCDGVEEHDLGCKSLIVQY